MRNGATRPSWLEIDTENLCWNYRQLRRKLDARIKIIASVKANAYGHGAVETARVLSQEGVDVLATGSFDDAVQIREAGIDTPILLFGGFLPEAAPEILKWNLVPTVYNIEAAEAVSRAALEPVDIYVKVDCGLGRLGVGLAEAAEFIVHISQLANVNVAGIYTHVPFETAEGGVWAARQLKEFERLLDALIEAEINVPVTQAMGSACLVAGLRDRCNAVSPGHLLYGLSPVDPEVATIAPYRPVVKALRTQLIHIGSHVPGVSPTLEGPSKCAGQGLTIGVVPLGRYDGYRKAINGEQAEMLLRGRRVPVLGVSLEHAMLDLSTIDDPVLGENVTALGEDGENMIGIEEVGRWFGLSPLDVMMTLDKRVAYRFRNRCSSVE